MKNVRETTFSPTIRQYIYATNRNPGEKVFNQAIAQISDQDYSTALDTLLTAKTNTAISQIIATLGGEEKVRKNPSVLATILTYTYGAPNVQHKEKVTNGDFVAARTDKVIVAEKTLATQS